MAKKQGDKPPSVDGRIAKREDFYLDEALTALEKARKLQGLRNKRPKFLCEVCDEEEVGNTKQLCDRCATNADRVDLR